MKIMKKPKSMRLFNYTLIPFEQVYRFKITLQVTPLAWRLIEVPACYDFWNLHCAIQDAMGWKDCHLHEFRIMNPKTGDRVRMILDEKEAAHDTLYGWDEDIADFFSDTIRIAEYEYDFGDSWSHWLELEGVYPRLTGAAYPRCLAGERACPPEDCGGAIGYEMLLAALKDRKHPEHKAMKRWVGKDFDPEWFPPGEVHFSNPQERWDKVFMEKEGTSL